MARALLRIFMTLTSVAWRSSHRHRSPRVSIAWTIRPILWATAVSAPVTARTKMGHAIAKFRIRATGGDRSHTLELLVDTGSTYTWIDGGLLRRLGVVPTRRRRFETIEGKRPERRLGEAVVEYEGEAATTVVVFGRRTDAQVLGVHALEGLGLAVDPERKRLRKMSTVLAL